MMVATHVSTPFWHRTVVDHDGVAARDGCKTFRRARFGEAIRDRVRSEQPAPGQHDGQRS